MENSTHVEVELLSKISERAFRALLPNNKEIIAHLPGRGKKHCSANKSYAFDFSNLQIGDKVEVELSFFCFEKGIIRRITEK